jgi:hypothetical protein
MKDAGCRLGFQKEIWFMGIFSMATLADRDVFNWGKPAGLPYRIKSWQGGC